MQLATNEQGDALSYIVGPIESIEYIKGLEGEMKRRTRSAAGQTPLCSQSASPSLSSHVLA